MEAMEATSGRGIDWGRGSLQHHPKLILLLGADTAQAGDEVEETEDQLSTAGEGQGRVVLVKVMD